MNKIVDKIFLAAIVFVWAIVFFELGILFCKFVQFQSPIDNFEKNVLIETSPNLKKTFLIDKKNGKWEGMKWKNGNVIFWCYSKKRPNKKFVFIYNKKNSRITEYSDKNVGFVLNRLENEN